MSVRVHTRHRWFTLFVQLPAGGGNAADKSGKTTEENSVAENEKTPPTEASISSGTRSNSNSSQENDDDGTEPGNFDEEENSKSRKGRRRKSVLVNTMQLTPEEKLEAEARARRLLKKARCLLRADRTKRSASEQPQVALARVVRYVGHSSAFLASMYFCLKVLSA